MNADIREVINELVNAGPAHLVMLQEVTGGLSGNSIYRLTLGDQSIALKLYHGRSSVAEQEWSMLARLAEAGIDFSPEPLLFVPGSTAVVAMSWCDGVSLGHADLSSIQIERIAVALRRFGLAKGDFPNAGNHPIGAVDQVLEVWSRTRCLETLDEELEESRRLVDRWLCPQTLQQLRSVRHPWIGRGDPNLANILWGSQRVHFVDFEHSGQTDRALEMADMAEHIQSDGCGENVWSAMWEALEIGEEELERINLARKMYSVFWLGLLLADEFAKANNPPQRAHQQARRVKRLLS